MIAGFETPERGTIEIGGTLVAGNGHHLPPERRKVGMVFQHYALFPHLDVAGNVGYGLDRGPARSVRVGEVLEMVGLPGAAGRMPHELSGGEQQRVALARALAPKPDVVLLDEPFSNLDAPQRGRVRRDVRAILVEARATALFVTHDQEEALAISDEVAVVRRGRVVQQGSPADLYLQPADPWVARFLGEAVFVAGRASAGRVETALGSFPTTTAAAGDVEVMIRPEAVRLVPSPSGGALVVDREFYGHDQLVTLHLDGGHRLLSRTGPRPRIDVGDRVEVRIEEVVVFEKERGTGD
jgi:iron(III) transport system ATP-binding protein